MDPDRQAFLRDAADMGDDRVAEFDLYTAYYDGDHETKVPDRAREFMEASGLTFAENYCEPIIDAIAARLLIERFTVTRGGQPDDELTAVVNDWWDRANMDDVTDTVHTQSLVLGEYAIVVDASGDRPTFIGNDPRNVRGWYADTDPDAPEYVAKVWSTVDTGPSNPGGARIRRLNLYFPDRIERYFSTASDNAMWDMWVEDGVPWPEWTTSTGGEGGDPLGIPVQIMRNRPLGRHKGRSELRGDIPMQDLHNKLVIDLALVMDAQAWTQRYVTGQSKDNAEVRNIPGAVWFFPSADAGVGSFPSENPAGALAAIESQLSRRARRAQIPLHLLTGGDVPSGEALRSAEAPLVKKVENRMRVYGGTWGQALMVALRYYGHDTTDVDIDVEWVSPETRDDVDKADAALKWQDVGVSRDTLLERNGFDPGVEAARRADETAARVGSDRALFGGVQDMPPFQVPDGGPQQQ